MDWSSAILLLVIIIGIITCLFVLFSLLFCNYFSTPIEDRIRPSIFWTTLFSYILFIAALVSFGIFNLFPFKDFKTHWIRYDFAVISWNFAQILVYILLLLRIRHSFSDTIYKIHDCIYIIFLILLSIYILCCFMWILNSMIAIKIYDYDEIELIDEYNYLNNAYVFSVEIIDLIISILLIYVFIKQIIKIAVDLSTNEYGTSSSSSSIDSNYSSFNIHQRKLMNIISRYSLLSIIATICTQLNTFLYCSILISSKINPNNDHNWIFWAFYADKLLFCIDCIINPLCLHLLFAQNEYLYGKLCNKCHIFIALSFRRSTKKRIRKKFKNYKVEMSQSAKASLLEPP